MFHPSQKTKSEYANKHESENTVRLANLWEQKIGSGKTHDAVSPDTVVKASPPTVPYGTKLSRAGSKQTPDKLQRKKTSEIVQTFEKMASIDADNAHSGLKSSLGKAEKGVSGNKPTGMKEEANLGLYEGNEIKGTNRHGAAKEDLMAIIARLSSRVEETEKDLATLAEKVRKL